MQLLHDLKETRGYWKLKGEALDNTVENSIWKKLWTCHVVLLVSRNLTYIAL